MHRLFPLSTFLLLLTVSGGAAAHVIPAEGAGLGTGFLHPFTGLDHLLAALLAGAWAGSFREAGSRRLLAALFLLGMFLGVGLGLAGHGVPLMEPGLALSLLVFGLLLATAVRPTAPVAGLLAGGFALLHGNAHGIEFPAGLPAAGYVTGLVLGTSLLLVAGLGLARALRCNTRVLRMAGLLGGAVGVFLLVNA